MFASYVLSRHLRYFNPIPEQAKATSYPGAQAEANEESRLEDFGKTASMGLIPLISTELDSFVDLRQRNFKPNKICLPIQCPLVYCEQNMLMNV